jgi:hypothetical protein
MDIKIIVVLVSATSFVTAAYDEPELQMNPVNCARRSVKFHNDFHILNFCKTDDGEKYIVGLHNYPKCQGQGFDCEHVKLFIMTTPWCISICRYGGGGLCHSSEANFNCGGMFASTAAMDKSGADLAMYPGICHSGQMVKAHDRFFILSSCENEMTGKYIGGMKACGDEATNCENVELTHQSKPWCTDICKYGRSEFCYTYPFDCQSLSASEMVEKILEQNFGGRQPFRPIPVGKGNLPAK